MLFWKFSYVWVLSINYKNKYDILIFMIIYIYYYLICFRWFFGVFFFEIVIFGGMLYLIIDIWDLLWEFENGYWMEKLENCLEEMWVVYYFLCK